MRPIAAAMLACLLLGGAAPGGGPSGPSAASVLRVAARREVKRPVAASAPSMRPVFVGVLLIVLVAGGGALLSDRLSRRHWRSLNLIVVLIGFVLLMMLALPVTGHPGWVGTVFFFGLAGVYKLLGRFETPGQGD